MAVDFATKIDPELLKAFTEYEKKAGNLSMFWRQYTLPLILEETKEVFETRGFGKWPARKVSVPHPLLRKTGRLFNSWTKAGASDNITRVTGDSVAFGTDTSYYRFLRGRWPIAELITQSQRGAKRSLRRKISDSLANFLTVDFKG